MNEREELEALRRLAELEAKAAGNVSKQPKGATGTFTAGASGTWTPEKPSGFKRGFVDDPLNALKQIGAESEIGNFIAPEWAKSTRQDVQQSEQAYQQARGENGVDWARIGGQVINPINLAVSAATKVPPGVSLLGRTGMGAVGGAGMGALSPVYGDSSRSEQTLVGGAGGAIAAPITGAIARVVSPKVDPKLDLLRKEGVTPTVGQSFGGAVKAAEDKAMSLPILGDAITSARQSGLKQFQVAAYNRALSPIGQKASGKIGFDGMHEVHSKLSQAYDDVLPKLSFKPDQKFTTDESQLRNLVSQLDPADSRLFDNIVGRVKNMATPQGNMSGETFKRAESELGNEIKSLASDTSYGKQKVMEALQQYRNLMREGLSRSNPMYSKRLANINEGWANYAILRQAASGVQAAKNEGMFTPAQLAAGVQTSAKRAGKAVGQGKLSEGNALMQDLTNAGQQVLPSQYPDSGTAGRLVQGALLGGAAAGQVPFTLGTLGGLSAASLPYMPFVRKGTDALLNARPAGAGLLADIIRTHPSTIAPAMIYGFD